MVSKLVCRGEPLNSQGPFRRHQNSRFGYAKIRPRQSIQRSKQEWQVELCNRSEDIYPADALLYVLPAPELVVNPRGCRRPVR